jgi:glycosyltransferase involved in cell wall biosynthesis
VGCPVVVTDVGGNGEVVRDGCNGLVVRPCDADALRDAILALSQDRRWATQLGRQASVDVRRLHSFPRAGEAIANLYKKACLKPL